MKHLIILISLVVLVVIPALGQDCNCRTVNPLPHGNANYSMDFLDSQTGIIGSTKGKAFKTVDGGSSWVQLPSPSNAFLFDLQMITSELIYGTGQYGVIVKSEDGGQNWSILNSGTTKTLNAIHFLNETRGYAAGDDGIMMKTVDGGRNWTTISYGTDDIRDIFFVNSDTGFAAVQGGKVYRTLDEGETWSQVYTTGAMDNYSVYFTSSTTGYVSTSNGWIYKTDDAGLTWTGNNTPYGGYILNLDFWDENTGFASCGTGNVLYTTNGGSDWNMTSISGLDQNIYKIRAVSATGVFIAGLEGYLMKSTDGAVSFSTLQQGTLKKFLASFFVDENTGYATGEDGLIWKTEDGGDTWTDLSLSTTNDFYSVFFFDASNGFIGGSSAMLYKTTDGGSTWTPNNLSSIIGSTGRIYDIDFPSAGTGYIAASSGNILKTTDGGSAWVKQNWPTTLPNRDVYSIHFKDNSTGWAVGDYATALYTGNGGNSWEIRGPEGSSIDMHDVHFIHQDTLYVASGGSIDGGYYITTDGGNNWTYNWIGHAIKGIDFSGRELGAIVGEFGSLLITKDYGETWQPYIPCNNAYFEDVAVLSPTSVLAFGADGNIMKIDCTFPDDHQPEFINVPADYFSCGSGSIMYFNVEAFDREHQPVTLTATSSDQALVQNSNIIVTSAAEPFYTLKINPESGVTGTVTINMTANDGTSTGNASFDITFGAAASYDMTASIQTEIACHGYATGEITTSVTAPPANALYSIDGDVFQSGNLFSDLGPGQYQLVVKDENGCRYYDDQIINLSQPDKIMVSSAISQEISCFNVADGVVSASASGGTGDLSYSLDNSVFGSLAEFSDLGAGSYKVYVKDENACLDSSDVAVLTNPSDLTLTADITAGIDCYNEATAEITADGSGGTGNLSYSIDGINFIAGKVFQNLTAGDYTVTVRDENLCTETFTGLEITQPDELALTASLDQDISCYNLNDAAISASAAGGTPDYQFKLNSSAYSSISSFSNLAQGTYKVYVRDNKQCIDSSGVITVTNPEAISGSAIVDNTLSCPGDQTAEIEVTADGGTGELSYSLNNTDYQTSNIFTELGSGTYTVYIKDDNSCIKTLSNLKVDEPEDYSVTAQLTQNVSCFGGSTGAISASVDVPGIYFYSLDLDTYKSTGNFTGLTAGDYKVYVKNSNNCIDSSDIVTISEPQELTVSADITAEVSCNGLGDAEITALSTGGTGSVSFSLDGTNYGTDNTFANLIAGNYTVYVKDENDCEAVSAQVVVSEPDVVDVTAVPTNETCHNLGDGSISASGEGGTGNLEFSLDNLSFGSIGEFSALVPGDYKVYARDENGCLDSTGILSVSAAAEILPSASLTSEISCYGANDAEISASATGGTGLLEYSLDKLVYSANNVFSSLMPGEFKVYVRDENACVDSTDLISVDSPAEISLTASLTADITCNGENDAQITASATGGTGGLTYSLNAVQNQSGLFTDLGPGNYTVTVEDDNNCQIESEEISIVEPEAVEIVDTTADLHDGDVEILATGGTGSLSYSLDNNQYQPDNSFTGLSKGEYTFYVKDQNECMTSIEIEILGPVSTEEFLEKLGLNIYPNPTDGLITIQSGMEVDEALLVRLFNPSGVLLEEYDHKGGTSLYREIDIRDKAEGLYILEFIGRSGTYQFRIVKK